MGIVFERAYHDIISPENLVGAWREFARGKRSRADVQAFERNLMANVLALHRDLAAKTYRHDAYQAFKISDPKPRDIHKATVRDRLLHHAVHRALAPFFGRTFIADSYSCQTGKGTHRAARRFAEFTRAVSRNGTKTAWVLNCDIRKFFASIDQSVLLSIVARRIPDADIVGLVGAIVGSFHSGTPGKGLPLGNLTSQLLVNAYLDEFDQFVKHQLRARHYVRYADDFVILSRERAHLEQILPEVRRFLRERLRLDLHPRKVSIGTVAAGVDFLGWVHFADHRVLRTSTKRRMIARLRDAPESLPTRQSYRGLLSHGNTWKLRTRLGL